ncbi:methionyl-tRNA formyltransferase [Candidatus Campbellbacteria bacterium CG11_big_fil_rev_8_21_14_0_20_44_21]|uniref:methionyl-tRNA formyltransferase n=1 Tax=Candidatus Campbellbacteria bacterium CG22_combo_CG10-13_8_21_14_all_43_18 TaxID=1974530 RepID=A0A2H0DWK1_9BACT|nr:MAG: methionyl-tRNA formyltransferase [Candidatus Campbellbacteria bacterium CG22_combo_CG10-13_8_21_14_all_43_18]PIR24144.1 MAG: methionyl-tRNA formyltransferase [Candidatus Campbellbacteria bacterium CG11_big_fil_rev_8_21_14_0_20_44_21]
MMKENKDIKFAYFGTSDVSAKILDILKEKNLAPVLVVTSSDKPRGRGMEIKPSPVKVWAGKHNIKVLQPKKADKDFTDNLKKEFPREKPDVFVVVAYGVILPKEILDMPKRGSINLHYSLLPRLRGPAPVEGALLEDINPTGVSTILMDEKMDHGPILMQESVEFKKWPLAKNEIFKNLNETGGKLLVKTINAWVNGNLNKKEQKHDKATYTKMIKKEDALLDFGDNPEKNLRKIYAYEGWPRAYFFIKKNDKKIRVIVKEAAVEDGVLVLKKVLPEGKKEMSRREFDEWRSEISKKSDG